MVKAIFFDIDGTLVSFKNHQISQSTFDALYKLKEKGINIRVIDVHTIKPIDEEMIIKCSNETKKLISIEDHSVIGGLGSAISEVLTSKAPKKLIRMGINDVFGKSGKAEELISFFKIDYKAIVEHFVNFS